MTASTDIIIVGAGITGLHLATLLTARARDVRVIEARRRVGGRVLTEGGLDLGPSWFWPQQPRMLAAVQHYGLQVFQQHTAGDLMYDNGELVRRLPAQPQAPSLRVHGGMGALVDAMQSALDTQRLTCDTRLLAIRADDDGLSLTLDVASPGGTETLSCRQVVLTLPPRLLADTVRFDLPLEEGALAGWRAVPTWMAGHAKAVITYPSAFWREQGLSGDAFSQRGPLGEIHDASTDDTAALFGFFAWPYAHRATQTAAQLQEAISQQLVALFGEPARLADDIRIKDWSADDATATVRDRQMLNHHPTYGLHSRTLVDGRIILAGTETDDAYGGYLEGALNSAERTAQLLAG